MAARIRRIVYLFMVTVLFISTATSVRAQTSTARITGVVVDEANGLPVSGATLTLYSAETAGQERKSDPKGDFDFDGLTPGVYSVLVVQPGYDTSRSADVVAIAGAQTAVNLVINQARTSQNMKLRTIGTVRASSVLASTTTITRTIDPQTIQKENYIRVADALVKLPGINGAGLTSAIGDDISINIRGLGPSETTALLDGHPVGPQGAYAINGGGTFPSSYNFANSPITGLSKVQVTFGSGATGLYGVDAIGGTIDMQTLTPTQTRQFTAIEGAGDEGRRQSSVSLTGKIGRLGYALAGGVQGSFGLFSPGLVAQTGRPNNNPNLSNNGACTAGNDISPCNLALNTYSVSGNTTEKSGLAKLTYALSNNTSFTSTVYAAGQQADSTGNGDNDNIPYATRLAQIQTNQTPNCDLPGAAAGSMAGYTVITTAAGDAACYSAEQFARNSYGPYGGGADRNRGTNMADYHFRLQTASGKHTIVADGFHNHYKFYKSSAQAGGLDASGTTFQGSSYSQFIDTNGYLVSDDIAGPSSDIGFGFYGDYQLGTRLNYNVTALGAYNYNAPETTHYVSGFARASTNLGDRFSVYGNFWVKRSSVDETTSFDPRVSLVFKPVPSDILRLTYGHSTGDPAAELKAAGDPVLNGNPSSLNPSCTPYNQIGNGGNPILKPERANDYEFGYAHRFRGASSIQANFYYTNVGDQLFAASEPLSQFGTVSIPASLLAGYAAKIASAGCAGVDPANPSSVLKYLSIGTTFNALSAVSRGVELTGHQGITRQFSLDYGYNLQSVVQNGVTPNILASNPFIVNGGQVQGIPINQGNVGIDYDNGSLEIRTDGYIVGSNNPRSRPGYNTWDAFVTKGFESGLSLTLGISNVFNEATQSYGYFGSQKFIAENANFADRTSIQQYVTTGQGEQFGVPFRSFSVTAQMHI